MTGTGTIIAYAALFLSLLGFIASQLTTRRSASTEYVKGLESRLEKCEDQLAAAGARVVELEAENLRLMRRLMLNGGNAR